MATPANAISPDAYILSSVLLEGDRLKTGASIELKAITSDIEIYEHMEKPYLTGIMVVVDNHGLFDQINFMGNESVTIRFKAHDSITDISKKFTIIQIDKAVKPTDSAETITFTLLEESALRSATFNVNKCYKGTPQSIIKKILEDTINKKVISYTPAEQENIKVIVPNMEPLDACDWVKDRSTSAEGMPFFLFSTLVGDELKFLNLGEMLVEPSITKIPFRSSFASTDDRTSENVVLDGLRILSHSYKNTDNLYGLIKAGSVGALHTFYDPGLKKDQDIVFNVSKDVFKPMVEKNILKKTQSDYIYSELYQAQDKPMHETQMTKVSSIGFTGLYSKQKGLDEEVDTDGYRNRVIGKSIKNFLKKNPITIVVPCQNFISAKDSFTVGRIIDLRFLSNDPNNAEKGSNYLDKKKSGEYIIYSTKHLLQKERYVIAMTCLKLANADTF